MNAFINQVVTHLPASNKRQAEIKVLLKDPVYKKVWCYVTDGWPDKPKINSTEISYFAVAGDITVHKGLIMHGSHILIPDSMSNDMLAIK